MKDKDEQGAYRALSRLVGVRPRTEAELARRLAAKGFSGEVVQRVLERGREAGVVDDCLFARLYAEDRLLSRPCSRRLVADELRHRGVAPDLAQTAAHNALPEEGDEELARRALASRRSLWDKLPPEAAQRRAVSFLLRRGFSRDVSRLALESRREEGE